MKELVVKHGHAQHAEQYRDAEQAFGIGPLFYGEHHLREMNTQRQRADYAAACEHLYEYVVVHIREDPVFYVIRPVWGDGLVESDAEDRGAQEIIYAALPYKEPARIGKAAFEEHGEKFAHLIPQHYQRDYAAHCRRDIEYAHESAHGRPCDHEPYGCRNEDHAAYQRGGAAERKANAEEKHERQHIVYPAELFCAVSQVETCRKEHAEHAADVVAHAPSCYYHVLIHRAVLYHAVEDIYLAELQKYYTRSKNEDICHISGGVFVRAQGIEKENIEYEERERHQKTEWQILYDVVFGKDAVEQKRRCHEHYAQAQLTLLEKIPVLRKDDKAENHRRDDYHSEHEKADAHPREVEKVGGERRLRSVRPACGIDRHEHEAQKRLGIAREHAQKHNEQRRYRHEGYLQPEKGGEQHEHSICRREERAFGKAKNEF